jgi:predicted Zn-dependent peptidase
MRKRARTAIAISVLIGAMSAYAAAPSDLHIPFEKYKLQNGMRVVLSRDTAVPVIAVYLIYDVGARSEEKGRTGFAHLFEHMMFEGSANVKKGDHFKYIEANGGEMNGSTHPDYTDFFETLPSNKLSLALWLESDRMRSLAITPENLKNQQEAVKQEKRLSFDNQPYNTAIIDKWPTVAFENFQSSHSLIGSYEDLEAASVDDVAKFFRTYYAPNNAVLVIAGDFENADARKMIEQYFGNIPAQPQPKRPDTTEPVRTEGRQATALDQHAQVPAVVIGWPAPHRHSPEFYALGMLDAVLTAGQSGRLQLDLVKGKQSVLQYEANPGWPFASLNDFKDPGDYAVFALYKPNYKPQQIVDQVQGEIDQIAQKGVDAAELERIKAVLRYQKITGLESSLSRAKLLGQYELLDGKPEMMDQDFTNLFAVTSTQIQDVAKKYLTATRRDVLMIQPAPPPQQPAQKEGK